LENNVDLIISGILFVFFIIGCFKGFLKSIFGPLALVGCWIYAMHHYNQTEKFMVSIAIAILGPIILNICFSLLLKAIKKIFKKEDDISPLSRVMGGLVNAAWTGFYLILMLLLVAMIPFNNPGFVKFKDAIKNSYTYQLAQYYIGDRITVFKNLEQVSSVIEDPEKLKEISQTEKFQNLLTKEKVKTLREDPEIQEMIEDKNYTALMTHPKVQNLMQDKDLMLQFTAIVQEHAQKGTDRSIKAYDVKKK
jgi:uncharacterized membrane protein required for colicin V production